MSVIRLISLAFLVCVQSQSCAELEYKAWDDDNQCNVTGLACEGLDNTTCIDSDGDASPAICVAIGENNDTAANITLGQNLTMMILMGVPEQNVKAFSRQVAEVKISVQVMGNLTDASVTVNVLTNSQTFDLDNGTCNQTDDDDPLTATCTLSINLGSAGAPDHRQLEVNLTILAGSVENNIVSNLIITGILQGCNGAPCLTNSMRKSCDPSQNLICNPNTPSANTTPGRMGVCGCCGEVEYNKDANDGMGSCCDNAFPNVNPNTTLCEAGPENSGLGLTAAVVVIITIAGQLI